MKKQITAAEALARSASRLAKFNELHEAGKGMSKAAEKALASSQYWLDRANDLEGCGSID